MADVVQYRLERMVDEFEDLQSKRIFTRRELAEIAKKRRNFEYRIHRPSPLKPDFLAYIDYEKQVDALRRLRKREVSRRLVENGEKKLKRSVSDSTGDLRILDIYRLATTRFKGDIGLWFQYLEFCRERGHGRIKKVLDQSIGFHPNVPDLWIYAAAWEFNQNLDVTGARNTMQKALRACPYSEDLWVEYLRMELTYLNKLKARKVILGEDKGTLVLDQGDADETQWRDENKDLFMPLDEEEENADGPVQDGESEKREDTLRVGASSILQTVYDDAVVALRSSMSLRKRFLEIMDSTNLARSEELEKVILNDMKRDFGNEPEFWDWYARRQISNLKNKTKMSKEDLLHQLNKATAIYEEALNVVPSSKMFSHYAKFWMDVIAPENEESRIIGFSVISDYVVELSSQLLKVYEKAESIGCMTEDLANQHVLLLLQMGNIEEARKLVEKFCCGKLSKSGKLWVSRVSIEMKLAARNSHSPSKDEIRSLFELLQNALAKVKISEAESLWLMAIKFFPSKKYFNKLLRISLDLLARDAEGSYSLSSAIVNCVLQKDGIQCAREMYKRYLALPRPSLALHRNCIELEANLAFIRENDGLVNARKLYESALATYGQDVSLWRDYYSMEIKLGTSKTAGAIYWRAGKILKDTTGLVTPHDS